MAMPFNLGRPAKITIDINGYDAKRLIDKQVHRRRKYTKSEPGLSKLEPVAVPIAAVSHPNKPMVPVDDDEIESLNCALQTAPDDQYLQELFNGKSDED